MGGLGSVLNMSNSSCIPRFEEEANIDVTPNDVLPVSLTELKQALSIHTLQTEDDTMLTAFIGATTRALEKATDMSFMEAEFEQTQSRVSGTILIRKKPRLLSVTGISYLDSTSTTVYQTFNSVNYRFMEKRREIIALGVAWPPILQPYGLKITGTVGYAPLADPNDAGQVATARAAIPQAIRTAILLWSGYLFEHRQGEPDEIQLPTESQQIVKDMPPAVFNLIRHYFSYKG